MGVLVTTALHAMIYKKRLKLSHSSIKDYPKREIVAMTADLRKIS